MKRMNDSVDLEMSSDSINRSGRVDVHHRGRCYCCCGTPRRRGYCCLFWTVIALAVGLIIFFLFPRYSGITVVGIEWADVRIVPNSAVFQATAVIKMQTENRNYVDLVMQNLDAKLYYRPTPPDLIQGDIYLSNITAPEIDLPKRSIQNFVVYAQINGNNIKGPQALPFLLARCPSGQPVTFRINGTATVKVIGVTMESLFDVVSTTTCWIV
eukprot:Colp12_sorted_trinity150504_noHs@1850